MSGFKALNIESDSESDVSIDDTKEIQVEDALKLYQNALQAHAKAAESGDDGVYQEAAIAYEELFASDIFKWPESQTELRRIELYGPSMGDDDDSVFFGEEAAAVLPLVPLGTNGESGPSTLPQILHLAHKNYAQFKLEAILARLDTLNVSLQHLVVDALLALDHFVSALDKDEGDLDLWRRSAAVGEILSSKRIARFCLEAVLDGDDEALNGILALPGLEESLAGEKLKDLIVTLQDSLSTLQAPLSTAKRKKLSKNSSSRLNPYQGLATRKRALEERDGGSDKVQPHPRRITFQTPGTWAELGEMLLSQRHADHNNLGEAPAGSAIGFDTKQTVDHPTESNGYFDPRETSLEPAINFTLQLPKDITEMFPGLDNGRPTVQPRLADADPSMAILSRPSSEEYQRPSQSPMLTTRELPTRKRSGDTAGLNDKGEEGRTKSKRIRTRDSTADNESNRQAMIDANTRWEYEQQLNEFQAADDWMYDTVNTLFERIGVVGFSVVKNVRHELQGPTQGHQTTLDHGVDGNKEGLGLARSDLKAFLDNYNDELGQNILVGGDTLDLGQGSTFPGSGGQHSSSSISKAVSKTQMMPNDELDRLIEAVNAEWYQAQDVAWEWVKALLSPSAAGDPNSYIHYLWPEALKTMVVRTLVNFDETLYEKAYAELQNIVANASEDPSRISRHCEIVQIIFELHLDVFFLIREPNSGVDADTVMQQGDRLQRWSELAREAVYINSITSLDETTRAEISDTLNLRHLWATTFNLSVANDVTQEHVIECMQDLRRIFVAAGEPTLQLQNNAIMPELSVAALDREVSRLTTKDFFLRVTSQALGDPVAVIESIEPLLQALAQRRADSPANSTAEDADMPADVEATPELVSFVQNSNLSVRLMLWQRLRDAYSAIEYKPMVVSCYFHMIRLLLDEVVKNSSAEVVQSERQSTVLKGLRLIHNYISRLLTLIHSSDNALECLDEQATIEAAGTLGNVLSLLQVFNIHEDSIRVGQSQPPSLPNGLTVASFTATTSAVHDMQLHIWIILYHLLKDAVPQNLEHFPTPKEDQFDFLRCVHRNLGLRGICGGSNRAFVKLLKDEFFTMTHVEGYDSEQAQVLYDLYGLNCFLNPSYELIEHHCTRDAFLDRSVAMQAVDLLSIQATKLPMKDLVKHPLKDTIDKVHGAIARKKPTDAIMRNREIYRAFLRSPINPTDLYACLKGEGNQLSISHVPQADAILASKGWYFLMGHISLSKFRTQKRTAPTPTEDVDIAIAFFMQDLEYSMDNWETWFRLAQAYDTKIEESVVWSAEKLNNSMPEIVGLQRAAIHCYTMATALAYRSANLAFETSGKMTELYIDFATRLYSSSREPFSMLPFGLEDLTKFLSSTGFDGKLPEVKPFQPMRNYTCWKLARVLFQRAIPGMPRSWMLHYQLGKCLWKMHAATPEVLRRDKPPSAQQVLECFLRALELAPGKKDTRDSKREPVLEPHYKLVSIVHKMVMRKSIGLDQAREALENTQYARTATFPDNMDNWVEHVLAILSNLRTADKSNWHHRMIYRAARIIYDDSDGDNFGPLGAKHELTKQMFTKTMVLQVWRPESERAGRHFVYTARYTRFFTSILEQLKDRASLEQLARRVRRRPHDVFEHSLVWQDICNAYLRLLRAHAQLAEGMEMNVFSAIAHEDFLARKDPLEKWMQAQETGSSPTLDVLREVQELKKINQGLMKPGPIDDLIGDSYAYLFSTVGRQLYEEERRIKQEEEASRPPPALEPAPSPARNPTMSLSHLMNVDGSGETKPAVLLPSPAVQPTQTMAPPTDQAPTRRKIGVGRREIRTTAEACLQKVTTQANKPTAPTNVRVEVVIHRDRPILSGEASVETSAPGSVHDSADDESELSELEEEGEETNEDDDDAKVARRPLFPGLEVESMKDSPGPSEGFETAEEGEEDGEGREVE